MSEPLPEIDFYEDQNGDDDDDGRQCLDVADEVGRAEEASIEAGQAEPSPASPPVRQSTRGERLVGLSFNPSGDQAVTMAKIRSAMLIDDLSNLPLLMIERNGSQTYDTDHLKIVEEAIARQVDATMWAVKALTWGK